MTSATLRRLAGMSGMISGVLTVLFWMLHPTAGDPHAERGAAYWEAVQSDRFVAVNGMFLLIILTLLLAFTSYYAQQASQVGRIGLVGFVLGFLGTAMFIGPGIFTAFVVPALAASEATRPLLGNDGPFLGGPLGAVFAAGGITFAAGFILFGISTARAGVLPRGAGWILVISSPILGLSPLMPLWARAGGSTLYGIAILWLGLTLWRSPQHGTSGGRVAGAIAVPAGGG